MAQREKTYDYSVYVAEFALDLISELTENGSIEDKFGLNVDIDARKFDERCTMRIINDCIELYPDDMGPMGGYYIAKLTDKQLDQFIKFMDKFDEYSLEKYNERYNKAADLMWYAGTDDCLPNAFLYGFVGRIADQSDESEE